MVRKIQYDLDHDKDSYIYSSKEMEEIAKNYIALSSDENINYYDYYKNKYCNDLVISKNDDLDNSLKERLIDFRKKRSNEMNIPAYYVFTNDELDKLVELKPKTIEQLKNQIYYHQ